jgi:hypothetical protein
MQNFTYYAPTEVVFGKGAEDKVAALVKKHGGSRVYIVYGGGSVVRSGLLGGITAQLDNEGIAFMSLGGVQPNPHLSLVYKGVAEAAAFNADLILAVGGGSAIDTAKAIAHGTKNPETDVWKFWLREVELTKSLPVGVVVTISAAGSEMSNSAVITNAETGKKRGLATDFNRPAFAVMNPEFTFTLPKYQISCGIADIMMHTLDRFFSPAANNEMTDEIAAALLRVVMKNGLLALRNPKDYDAMSELMWAGSLSHNGITGLGRLQDFSVHQIGHELGGRFDVAHGASLTTMWGSWARYTLEVDLPRYQQYAKMVWGAADAEAGIEKTVTYFKEIGMPTSFTELSIGVQNDEVINEMADSCVFYGKRVVGTFKPLEKDDIAAIYRLANR